MLGDSSLESLDGQYSDDHSAQETGNESEEHSDDKLTQCMYGKYENTKIRLV